MGAVNHLPSLDAKLNLDLFIIPVRQDRHTIRSLALESRCDGSGSPSAVWALSSSNMRGMLILTEHASWQAPHRVDAAGRREPSLSPVNTGETIEPIGPGYTHP